MCLIAFLAYRSQQERQAGSMAAGAGSKSLEERVAADVVKYVFTFLDFADLRTMSALSSYWPEFFRDRGLYKRCVCNGENLWLFEEES